MTHRAPAALASILPSLAAVLLALGAFPAAAQTARTRAIPSAPAPGPADSRPESVAGGPERPAERFEVDSENLFGFTTGTDTQTQGEREVSHEVGARFGKRGVAGARPGRPVGPDSELAMPESPEPGGFEGGEGGEGQAAGGTAQGSAAPAAPARRPKPVYRAVGFRTSFQYGVTDDFSIEFGVLGDARRQRNVPGLLNKTNTAFNGVNVEFAYRFLERTRDNPFGLALIVEPSYERVSDVEGRGQHGVGVEAKLAADVRLIPGRLWAGFNVGIESERGILRGTREIDRDSTFAVSGALSARVLEGTYLGAEVRYLRKYEGFTPGELLGDAVFVGPTAFVQFRKGAYISAAYGVQVAGRTQGPDYAGRRLDLTNFERQVAKVKLGVEF